MHRWSTLILVLAGVVALAAVALGTTLEGRALRVGVGVALPLALLVIPAVQSIPLPLSLRQHLDSAGTALLADSDAVHARAWPMSLDPATTREHVGRAAAALAVFLVAYHLASGKRRRHFLPRLIALTGVAALAIALGHRIFGITEIYGTFKTNARSLLTGPFVNANHTAEFLELAASACLACSLHRNTALNRYGWSTGAIMCAAGAIGTLSRGAVVGLLAGILLFAFLRFITRDDRQQDRKRMVLAWAVLVSLLIAVTAGALGAGALVDRFRDSAVNSDVRFHLWRDSLRVLAAHPLGIGRGAFERVYPVYRTLQTNLSATFAYVENHPLQLLIDSGWLLFILVIGGLLVVIIQIVRHGRRDKVEAAFLAGLFAVCVHSCVDFGLETLGVALPFVALLGTVLGRSASEDALEPRRWAMSVVGVACAGMLFGTAAIAHPTDDDFDVLLKRARTHGELRELLVRAQATHPTDYFYVLAYAKTEPLRKRGVGRSPRLHALNHALRLCPGCELVHLEVARSLWALGSRGQSLVEWRTAVQLQPKLFTEALAELAAKGGKPYELAAVASFDPAKMIEVAAFLAERSHVLEALQVLDQADAMGAPRTESLLTRCRLQIDANQISAAETTVAELRAAGIQDARLSMLQAQLILATKHAAGADEALAILEVAAARYPLDVGVQRFRLQTVESMSKWHALDRAIDGFKLALYHSQGSALEANLSAARIRSRLSQWAKSLSEYRVALSQAPGSAALWAEYAQTAERAGRDSLAREAYAEAARLAPSDPQLVNSIRRLDARLSHARGAAMFPSPPEPPHVP